MQHTSTRKGPYSCSPRTPSLAALQAPPSHIQGAVKDKTVMKCPEMILLEYDDWSYLGMKPVLTDDTLDHLIIDLLGK